MKHVEEEASIQVSFDNVPVHPVVMPSSPSRGDRLVFGTTLQTPHHHSPNVFPGPRLD